MPTATVTSKGQITIPKRIRQALRLSVGDRVEFVIARSGEVLVRPGKADVGDLKGLLRRRNRKTVSLAEMDRAIARGLRVHP